MNNPLVSIILPTYNWNHNWLCKSLDSVLTQSYKNFELIIINDCSTNDIEKTILKYKEKDDRIVYIKNEKNLRLTKTLNKGIEISKWKYIARIDDDDIWCEDNKLQKQVDFMEQNPDYWLCWTQVILIDENDNELELIKKNTTDKNIRKKILSWTQFAHWSVIIRKKTIDTVWKYDTNWDFIEDYELWLRIWTKYKFSNLSDFSFKYRINRSWISSSNALKQRILNIKVAKKYKNNYPNFYLWLCLHIKEILKEYLIYITIKIKIYNFLFPIYKKIEKMITKN